MLGSVIKTNSKYYPHTFLEECKYKREKIKAKNYNDDKLEEAEPDDNDEDDKDDEDDE